MARTWDGMARGGIYDQLGGGFHRYTVDGEWLVPHFEKMLYDNAEIVGLMTLAYQETREPLFAERVRETVTWLEREMLAEADAAGDRAFAASLDADSEGVEGKFYVWSESEIDALLGGGADAALFKRHYDVTPEGNWEGHVILNRSRGPSARDPLTEATLASQRLVLLAARGRLSVLAGVRPKKMQKAVPGGQYPSSPTATMSRASFSGLASTGMEK